MASIQNIYCEISRGREWLHFKRMITLGEEINFGDFPKALESEKAKDSGFVPEGDEISPMMFSQPGHRALDLRGSRTGSTRYIFYLDDAAYGQATWSGDHDHGVKFGSGRAAMPFPQLASELPAVVTGNTIDLDGRMASFVIDLDALGSSPQADFLRAKKQRSMAFPFCFNLVARVEDGSCPAEIPVSMISGTHDADPHGHCHAHEHSHKGQARLLAHRGPHVAASSYIIVPL